MNKFINSLVNRLPRPLRDNINLKLWGINTPLINYLKPRVISIDEKRVVLEIKLSRRANSNWNSMFMGSLATGIDITGGFLAFDKSVEMNIGILYKDISMQFLRRADGDVHFICENGDEINEGLRKAYETGERINVPVEVKCFVPPSTEPCVIGHSTLSMKRRK
jgi:hypothetical protein